MSHHHDASAIVTPDRKGLRDFAFLMAAVVAAIFGLFFPWLLDRPFPSWPWIFAVVAATWGVAAPGTLGPIYRAWMRFGLVLNRIVSPAILTVVFMVVITPIALAFRVAGRHVFRRKGTPEANSYRIESERTDASHMDKPY